MMSKCPHLNAGRARGGLLRLTRLLLGRRLFWRLLEIAGVVIGVVIHVVTHLLQQLLHLCARRW